MNATSTQGRLSSQRMARWIPARHRRLARLALLAAVAGAGACSPSAIPLPPTPTPTATPFPTSLPQELSVQGNVEGTKFVAQESGVHRFTITAGAYSPCPTHVPYPACGKWLTALALYVNRDIDWSTEQGPNGFFGAVSQDALIGDSSVKDTQADAEAAGAGASVDIPLHKGDFVWFLPSDARGTYLDNTGAVTLSVTIVSPLP